MSAMFEKDLETFKSSPSTVVLATFNTASAHVILWADDKGYTVSEWSASPGYSQGNRSNGGATSLEKALAKFTEVMTRLAAPIIHFDNLVRETQKS